MGRKLSVPDSGLPPVPLWMVTFSDTMGLLVCLFVMIIGFSATEKEDRSRAPGMLIGYPGISETEHTGKDSYVAAQDAAGSYIHLSGYSTPPDYDPLSYVREGYLVRARTTVVGNKLQPRLTDKGFEINILPGEIFERDSDRFTPQAMEILSIVADSTRHLPHLLRVQAYVDDLFVPNEEFSTAEGLALQRAALVCRYLSEQGRVPATKLSMATELHESVSAPPANACQVRIVVLRPMGKKAL